MRVRFHAHARDELAEAALWYEKRRPGLGTEFRSAVREASLLIGHNPSAWPAWLDLDSVRCYSLVRFPYLLPYTVETHGVVILAVAHASRRSGYWRYRLPPD